MCDFLQRIGRGARDPEREAVAILFADAKEFDVALKKNVNKHSTPEKQKGPPQKRAKHTHSAIQTQAQEPRNMPVHIGLVATTAKVDKESLDPDHRQPVSGHVDNGANSTNVLQENEENGCSIGRREDGDNGDEEESDEDGDGEEDAGKDHNDVPIKILVPFGGVEFEALRAERADFYNKWAIEHGKKGGKKNGRKSGKKNEKKSESKGRDTQINEDEDTHEPALSDLVNADTRGLKCRRVCTKAYLNERSVAIGMS